MRANRRGIRYLSAAAGSTMLLAAFATSPAHADDSTTTLFGAFTNVTLAPGTAGKPVAYAIHGNAATATTVSGLVVTFDVSGIAGVATLTPNAGTCTAAGTLITCHEGSMTIGGFTGLSQTQPFSGAKSFPITLVPAAGASAGSSGQVSVTVSAKGLPSQFPTQISVSLADGPDLVVKGATFDSLNGGTRVAANAGSTYSRGLTFTNDGDQPAKGVTVQIESSGHGVDVPELHKNCRYVAPETATCYIPDLIAPGATETLSPAVKVLTSTDLMWQYVDIRVDPGFLDTTGYTVGTGAPFTLKDSTGAAQVPVSGQTQQGDIDPVDDFVLLKPTVAGQSADLTGEVSIFPTLTQDQYLGIMFATNDGPDFVQLGRSGEYRVTSDVKLPAGVRAVTVPGDWYPVIDGAADFNHVGEPGHSEYEYFGATELGAGSESGSSAGNLIIQPEPGFTGGTGTLTVGINGQSVAPFTPLFGNIDSDTSNDTVSFDIPPASS